MQGKQQALTEGLPPFDGLKHELLAAAYHSHAAVGQQGVRQFHYFFAEYERLIMWKVTLQLMRRTLLHSTV